jgi:hypothetical protein
MARKTETTAEAIKEKLEHAQVFAIACENPSALVHAITTEARVFGLIKTKAEVSGANGGPIPFDVSSLTDEQLDLALRFAGSLGLLPAGYSLEGHQQPEGGGSADSEACPLLQAGPGVGRATG